MTQAPISPRQFTGLVGFHRPRAAADSMVGLELRAWEPKAFPIQDDDSIPAIAQACERFNGERRSICSSVVLRLLEIQEDGARKLVEFTDPLNPINTPLAGVGQQGGRFHPERADIVQYLESFADYLDQQRPGGRDMELEVLVVHSLRAPMHVAEQFEREFGAGVAQDLASTLANKTDKADPADWARTFQAVQAHVELGADVRVGRDVARMGQARAQNIHEGVVSANGQPIIVPQAMKDNGMDPARAAAFLDELRAKDAQAASLNQAAQPLLELLKDRGLPGWEDDCKTVRQRIAEVGGMRGVTASMEARRLLHDMEQMTWILQERAEETASARAQAAHEDRLFRRTGTAGTRSAIGSR